MILLLLDLSPTCHLLSISSQSHPYPFLFLISLVLDPPPPSPRAPPCHPLLHRLGAPPRCLILRLAPDLLSGAPCVHRLLSLIAPPGRCRPPCAPAVPHSVGQATSSAPRQLAAIPSQRCQAAACVRHHPPCAPATTPTTPAGPPPALAASSPSSPHSTGRASVVRPAR